MWPASITKLHMKRKKLPALAISHSTGWRLPSDTEVSAAKSPDYRAASFLMLWHYSIHSLDTTKHFHCTILHCIMRNKWNLNLEKNLDKRPLVQRKLCSNKFKSKELERPVVGTINHPWHLQLHTWVRSVKRHFLPKWSFCNENLYRLKPELILLARPPSQAAPVIHFDLIVVTR